MRFRSAARPPKCVDDAEERYAKQDQEARKSPQTMAPATPARMSLPYASAAIIMRSP